MVVEELRCLERCEMRYPVIRPAVAGHPVQLGNGSLTRRDLNVAWPYPKRHLEVMIADLRMKFRQGASSVLHSCCYMA